MPVSSAKAGGLLEQSPRLILELMSDDRPQADRILVAQLAGEARHRAKWRELTADEDAAAVAALRELAGGRSRADVEQLLTRAM